MLYGPGKHRAAIRIIHPMALACKIVWESYISCMNTLHLLLYALCALRPWVCARCRWHDKSYRRPAECMRLSDQTAHKGKMVSLACLLFAIELDRPWKR